MPYRESNKSFVKNILQPYFREAGITVQEDTLDRIVDGIVGCDNSEDLREGNGHYTILQNSLQLLKQLSKENNFKYKF